MISNRIRNATPSLETSQERPTVRRSFLDLTRDAVELAELQTRLVKKEANEGVRGLVLPFVALMLALTVGLGTVPVALILVAQAIMEFGGIGPTGAYSIAAGTGILTSAVFGFGGWPILSERVKMFDRSSAEFKRNIDWFKTVISGRE